MRLRELSSLPRVTQLEVIEPEFRASLCHFNAPHFSQDGLEHPDCLCPGQPPAMWGRGRLSQNKRGVEEGPVAPHEFTSTSCASYPMAVRALWSQFPGWVWRISKPREDFPALRPTDSFSQDSAGQWGAVGSGGVGAQVSIASLSAQTLSFCLQGREEKHESCCLKKIHL